MRRRDVFTLSASAAVALPLVAQAQRRSRPVRLGYLSGGVYNEVQLAFFRQGLERLGWVDGREYTLTTRYAETDFDRFPALTDELLGEGIELLVVAGPASRMIKVTQRLVPIVFAFSGDPVAAGFVSGFARPGGNATGLSFLALDLAGKRLEILRELQPTAHRVAVLTNPRHPGEPEERRVTLESAERIGLQPVFFEMRNKEEVAVALTGIRSARCNCLTAFPDVVTLTYAKSIAEHAQREKLPSTFGWRNYCEAGGLLSYGPNMKEGFARIAYFVERIASGIPAGDIPIELPTVIEMVVNMKTAKEIGLAVPPSILARADETIE
jgi:putative tryptophan/tyrosine transport system substrate-binding protein